MSYALRARPLYRATNASVGTSGVAFQVQTTSTRPVKVHQVVIEVDARAFIGIGRSSTPPAPTSDNTVYQPAGERVYTLDGNDELERYIYVYSVTGTLEVFISHVG